MRVPESFEGLLSNLVMSSRVHQKHAEEHNVAGNTTSLRVVNFDSQFWSNLRLLHIEETTQIIVSGYR